MLAIKQRFIRILDKLNGPYRKQGESYLRITSKGKVQKILEQEALAPVSLADGIIIELKDNKLGVTIPSAGKVMTLETFKKKVIWSGNAAFTQPSLVLSVPKTEIVALSLGSSNWLVEVGEDPDFIFKAIFATSFNARQFISDVLNLLKSVALHAALAFVIAFFGNQLRLSFIPVAVEPPKQEEEKKIIPIELANTAESDFGGHGLGGAPAPTDQGPATDKPSPSQQRAQRISGGLSDIVSKMAKMSLGNLGKVATANNGTESNAAVDSLRGQLSAVRKTDLRGSFQFAGQGNVGKYSHWGVYSKQGKSVSSKELEEVAKIMQALGEDLRGCYETALLKYEELSVTVNYEAEVSDAGSLGNPDFATTGKTTPESEALLHTCMSKVLKRAKLSRGLSGVRIKNQFIFRS